MTQKSLIEPEASYVGTAIVIPTRVETDLAAIEPPVEAAATGSALATLRDHALSVPVPVMLAGLNEFKERRDAFRAWLLDQLIEGVHYGWSPGCEPKWCDENGKCVHQKEATHTLGKKSPVPLTSWIPKKSLYAAGSDFVCELLGVRDSYAADNDGWVQAGSPAFCFVVKCTLYSRANGEVLGDGLGQQAAASEQLGANAALKKAQKRAKTAAVLNWLSLRDLFTQDIEDGADKPRVENPVQTPKAPRTETRAKRAEPADLGGLIEAYKAVKPPDERTPEHFATWATNILSRTFQNAKLASEWSADEVKRCRLALEDGR